MVSQARTLFERRVKYFLLGLIAIFIGFFIYLIFRPNTHISKLVSQFLGFDMSGRFKNIDAFFIKFYFADYLWAFAFSCWLRCVFIDESERRLCVLIVSLAGISYEIIQFLGVFSGTGDIWDCLLYILAAWTVNILNINDIQKENLV